MFKEIKNTNSIDIKKGEVKSITGVYQGFDTFQTKMGEQHSYKFKTEKGIIGVFGFTHLNILMKNVTEGQMCRVTYTGTKECQTKFGLKNVHQCKVEIDNEYKPTHEKAVETVQDTFQADKDDPSFDTFFDEK